jgi:hypothetical protein
VDVRARRGDCADTVEHLLAVALEDWHAHPDRVGPGPRQPPVAVRRVREDQGVRPGEQLARDRPGAAAKLRNALEEHLEVDGDEGDRLLVLSAL